MAISYTREYEQLILFDLQSDKDSLVTVNNLLDELNHDIFRIYEFCLSKKDRIDNLADLLDKMSFIEKQEINLSNYAYTYALQDLIATFITQKVTLQDIKDKPETIFTFYAKISDCRFIDKQLFRVLKSEGHELVSKVLREIQHLANKPILRYLLEQFDIYNDLLDLHENLFSEKIKFEDKLVNGQQKVLLQQIRQSRKNYSRDTILLLKGLLETEGNYYHALKQQLDDQYNKIIQDKLLQLNKIVNMQSKVFIDERKVLNELKEYRKKYLRLQRYVFC